MIQRRTHVMSCKQEKWSLHRIYARTRGVFMALKWLRLWEWCQFNVMMILDILDDVQIIFSKITCVFFQSKESQSQQIRGCGAQLATRPTAKVAGCHGTPTPRGLWAGADEVWSWQAMECCPRNQ